MEVTEAAEATSSERHQGFCTWFNPMKGFGFITLADGSEQLFVHSSAIEGSARTLREGEQVEFNVEVDPKTQKSRACHVTGPGGAHVQGAVRSERRIDPADGHAYTRAEFLEEYGGLTEWDAAVGSGETEGGCPASTAVMAMSALRK
mmetsp:Transcript_78068/g.181085  ORF Transcript_78068/g.181085 Transcript_78068/m.181085 type:complete len:147 (+) Transcript_78068:103-543(+)